MLAIFVSITSLVAAGYSVTAEEIMSRVAANQDRAQAARAAFVYQQEVEIRLRDTYGKLVREELSGYSVMPDATGTHKDLVRFKGRYAQAGSMMEFAKSGDEGPGDFRHQADAHVAKNLRDHLTDNRKSRDGIGPGLFPLTAKEQAKYRFKLKGEEQYRGVDAYRIAFEPARKAGEDGEASWRGEALIGEQEFAPLLISTKLAYGIPRAARMLLGIDFHGMGFAIQYEKFADGVWFPVSYGTEFKMRILFVYSRNVAMSMACSGFRRTAVESSVAFEAVQ